MQIKVKVIAHSSRDAIEKLSENSYKVWVRAVAEKGRANEVVMKVLSLEFGVPLRSVRLVSGPTSSQKTFTVGD